MSLASQSIDDAVSTKRSLRTFLKSFRILRYFSLGELILYTVIISSVFFFAWLWLSQQLNIVLKHRVDAFGNDMTQLCATASSKAVVSEDIDVLKDLIKHISHTDFIDSASIYRLNGTLILSSDINESNETIHTDISTKSDEDNLTINKKSSSAIFAPLTEWLTSYFPLTNETNIPFLKEIQWNNTQVGWFKLVLNRKAMEENIKHNSLQMSLIILITFFSTLFISLYILMRIKRKHLQRIDNPLKANTSEKLFDTNNNIKHLSELVKMVKAGDKSLPLHFQTPQINNRINTDYHTHIHNGLIIQLSLSFEKDSEQPIDEFLEIQTRWHSVIFECSLMHKCQSFSTASNAFSILMENNDIDNAIIFMQTMQFFFNKYENTQQLPRVAFRCSLNFGNAFFRSHMKQDIAIAAGVGFDRGVLLLEESSSAFTIDHHLMSQIQSVPISEVASHHRIYIFQNTEEVVLISVDKLSLIERQSHTLLKKYWPDLI